LLSWEVLYICLSGDQIDATLVFARADFVKVFDRCHDFFPRLRRHGMYLGTESFTWQVGATPWFSRQGQAHIVSTAIVSPGSGKAIREVEATPWFRTSFSIDPQPASISPTINISIVFICAILDCGEELFKR
jgi:hypothetical protein